LREWDLEELTDHLKYRKLATARMLDPATAASSLGDILGLGAVDEDELYAAVDWLGERQGAIEQALARKHLRDGTLVLYDVSSSYLDVATLRSSACALAPGSEQHRARCVGRV
jgi:hypothetical protein